MLSRDDLVGQVETALRQAPVVCLLGPRQCGKTTLARNLAGRSVTLFDLENPRYLALLDEPMTALESLRGFVVIDEVQRRPDLFPMLRVLAGRRPTRARFLLLGSASPELLRQSSESLAGRVAMIEMGGFDLEEVGATAAERLWRRGGFPRSFLARSERESVAWLTQFVSTFVERDLAQLGFRIPAEHIRRFWAMLAHYHGQGLERRRASSIARDQ